MNKQTKVLLWVIGAIFALAILARFLLPLIFQWDYPFFYGHMLTPMMYPLGMLGMVLFWGLIIYLIYHLLTKQNKATEDDDLSVLKSRLSRGEITIEEYETIKKSLKEDR